MAVGRAESLTQAGALSEFVQQIREKVLPWP